MITRRLLRPAGSLISSTWTCPACARHLHTRPTVASLPRPLRDPRSARHVRSIHKVPTLAFDETFREMGIPGLYSQQGYQLAWTEYQSVVIDKLRELVAGEPTEQMLVKDMIFQFARDPLNAAVFNHASMAYNNHAFFNTLSTAPTELAQVPSLESSLVREFGSIETLKQTMLDQAAAMFGPGFVWLIWARDVRGANQSRAGAWRILNTYSAGTPFAEAGYRQQSIDTNTTNAGAYNSYLIAQPAYLAQKHAEERERNQRLTAQRVLDGEQPEPTNSVGSFGHFSLAGKDEGKLPPGGTNVHPVLCVNTWEHAWIYDYGLGGKMSYLESWWNAVDWSLVEQNTPKEATQVLATFARE